MRCCSKCMAIGTPSSIEVHHKDGDHSNNSIFNLMYLCKSCHMNWHAGNWIYSECNLQDTHLTQEQYGFYMIMVDNRIQLLPQVGVALDRYIDSQMSIISGIPGVSIKKSDVVSEIIMNFLAEKGHYPPKDGENK